MSKKFHNQNQIQNPKQKTTCYYIQGMHCASCEILIEKDIKNLSGVHKVRASLKKGIVEIFSNAHEIPNIEQLNNIFNQLGYQFYEEKPRNQKLSKEETVVLTLIAIAVISLFLFAEKRGFFVKYSLGSGSSIPAYFVFGLAAGVSSCAALVGGLLLALSAKWNEIYNQNTKKSFVPFALFNAGRLVSFAVLGGALGLIGSALTVSITTTSILTVIVSVIMIALALQMLGIERAKKVAIKPPKFIANHISDEKNLEGKFIPFLIGFLTFLIPCGFTLIAQTNALKSGSFITSALMLTAFALGTLPMLALISFGSVKLYTNKKFNRYFSFFAGLLILFFAVYTLNAQLNVLGVASLSDLRNILGSKNKNGVGQVAAAEGDYQVFQMTASSFLYYPESVTLKAGIPVKWQISNEGAQGCASAIYARGLYDKVIYLQPGLNEVTIPAPKPGTYKISCSMGMVPPVMVYVR